MSEKVELDCDLFDFRVYYEWSTANPKNRTGVSATVKLFPTQA